jgi:hypothetical protein
MRQGEKPKPGRRRAAPPWWLGGNEEECPHCEQGYAYEAEIICSECDEPMCPLCVARVGDRLVCPECAGGGVG